MTTTDFHLTNHGSIWLLTPVSPEAVEWAEQYLPEDAQTLGNAIAIEPRYVDPIVQGIEGDGLTVA